MKQISYYENNSKQLNDLNLAKKARNSKYKLNEQEYSTQNVRT